MLKLKINNW